MKIKDTRERGKLSLKGIKPNIPFKCADISSDHIFVKLDPKHENTPKPVSGFMYVFDLNTGNLSQHSEKGYVIYINAIVVIEEFARGDSAY